MTAKDHYDQFLAGIYSWMSGDFDERTTAFEAFLTQHALTPKGSGWAIDLGAGHGIQSVALARKGFHVKAIDFSPDLLNELKENVAGLPVEAIEDDIVNVADYTNWKPELILCCGDTLTHLLWEREVLQMLSGIASALVPGGKAVLTFRDYTTVPAGETLTIVPRKDDERTFTCRLEYASDYVTVTDTLTENGAETVSSYRKVRLAPETVVYCLEICGMNILFNETENGMVTLIAAKPNA